MADSKRKAALERMRAARNGDVSCAEQYVVPEAKQIIQQVSEQEYRSIVAERRSDWVVGKKDLGYADGGQELWQGKESVRQRVLEDERDRKLMAQMDPDGKKTKVVKEQAETAPSGRGAFLGALQKGAALTPSMPNICSKKEQNKLVDDMLEQMCGELEAEPESGAAVSSVEQIASEPVGSPPSCVQEENKDKLNTSPAQPEVQEEAKAATEAATAVDEKTPEPKMERVEASESDTTKSPGKEQQSEVPDVEMEILPDPTPNLSTDLIANGAQQQALRDQHGGLWFFFIDAFEDDRSSPPRVYLFGKVQSVSGGFCSCCLVVENLERCIHLLLKVDPEAQDENEEAARAAAAANQEFDSLCQKQCPNVKKLRTKLKWRNYAFEKPLPHGGGHLPFLKIVCDASGGLPREIHGEAFSHAFGVQTSLLERLLLTKQIMGPGWLRLKPGSFKNEGARLSHCAQEFRMTPNSFHWPRTDEDKAELAKLSPSSSPPLRMMSLSLQTMQQSSQAPHEVLAIACTLHTNVSPDAGSEDPRRGTWAAVRRFDTNPLPRDADKALAQAGMQTCNNELHLLSSFLAKVQEFDPDVVAGHNIYACDLDVLASRFSQLKVHQWQKLGRLRRPKDRVPRSEGRQGQGFWVGSNLLAGRLVCDVLLQSKDLLPKMGCYDLPNLAKEQLNLHLQSVEPETIASNYSTARTLKEFAELKVRHAHCIAQLVQTLQILPLTRQLTNLAGNLWNASLQNKRAERNELLLCHEFHKKKFVLPDKENAKKKKMLTDISMMGMEEPDDDVQAGGGRRKAAAYSGGLVLAPKAGLYDDFVMLLDFNSLYPSIIQEHNICFTTVDRPDEIEVANIATEAQLLSKTHADAMAEDGILPQVLRRLVDSRRQVKAAIKTEKNPKVLQVLEIRQKALKLTANSMYGCLGFQNSRFYAKPLAALITAKGREALQSTINVVNQELQLDVVYGDTDSVFVNTKTADFQQAMQIGEQIKRSVNKRYKRLEIEIDGVFVRLMLLKKKKYAAMKVVDWQKQLFETEFKGLDIVRRDWCGLAKEMGEAILMKILDTKSNQEESLEWIHQFLIDKCKEMDDGKVDVNKFVITKGLTKDPKDYPDAKKQPHVQVALRLISRGKNVRPGQEIGYVICNSSGEGSKDLLAERARHPHEMEMDKSLTLDVPWYKKQQVHPLVSRILAVVEGTSPARLAECIGIDAARFSQAAVVRAEEIGEGFENDMTMTSDLTAFFDRKLRFKDFPSTLRGVVCSKCGEVTKWQRFLLGETESTESKVALCCPACQTQVNSKVVRNLWFMQLRRMVKEHGEGWVQTDGSSGIEKTRRLTKGQNLVSEKTVYRELEFATHLCESASVEKETIEKMGKDAGIWLGYSSRNWLDVGQLFDSLKPEA